VKSEKRNEVIDLIRNGVREKEAKQGGEPRYFEGVKIEGSVTGNTNCNIYYNRRLEDRNATGPYMISCPNCTRRVSRKADACPGCRHPVSLHFQKLALQKAVKTLGVTLALIITATLAMAQTAVAPFLSFAALGNMIALAGAGHALSKIPPHI
jgi:hypothetical protein